MKTHLVLIKGSSVKDRVFVVMKNYKIVASKEPVAKFEVDMQVVTMKFGFCAKCGEWIVEQHPELKDTPWDYDIHAKKAIFTFYSLGNLVIEEEA